MWRHTRRNSGLLNVVSVEKSSKYYRLGNQLVAALRDVTLNIEAGVFLAIAGPSGSGKSTLLNLIGCIDTPTSGRILINGSDTSGRTPDDLAELRARSIGFIFQTFNLFPVLSAEENVEYPLLQFRELGRDARLLRRDDVYIDTAIGCESCRISHGQVHGAQNDNGIMHLAAHVTVEFSVPHVAR